MSDKRLTLLITHNEYLAGIARNCKSAVELEQELTKTTCLRTVCLIDVDWAVVYQNVREV